jgi:hypothetical protein
MQSPAADWHEPSVLWQMHKDPRFCDDVAGHLLAVAKISAPFVDQLVAKKQPAANAATPK